MDQFLPPDWTADRLIVSDVTTEEIELVSTLHRSCSGTAPLDPSFQPVEMAVYADLVQASARGESEGKPFRLQIIRDGPVPCGYFHAYGDHPWEGCFFISMFLIDPRFARRGIGRRVVQGLAEQAGMLGLERMLLIAFLANRDALSFWINQGFDRIEKFRRAEDVGKPDQLILERRANKPR
jgi:GNAT superfamily N-acetyltransferase